MELDSVLGVTPEGFDRQVSLNPFEERLNLPPVAVDVGNDKRSKFKVVGYEGDNLFYLGIIELYHAEVFRVLLLADVAGKVNHMTRELCHALSTDNSTDRDVDAEMIKRLLEGLKNQRNVFQ